MDDNFIAALVGESRDTLHQREQLNRKLAVLNSGLDVCNRYADRPQWNLAILSDQNNNTNNNPSQKPQSVPQPASQPSFGGFSFAIPTPSLTPPPSSDNTPKASAMGAFGQASGFGSSPLLPFGVSGGPDVWNPDVWNPKANKSEVRK